MTPETMSEARMTDLHAAFRVFTDATANLEREYKRLQIHARQLREELQDKNRRLRESLARQRQLEVQALRHGRLAAMGEMAATLAHEVRNPLGAMELFTLLLLDEIGEQPAARRLAEQVGRGITDLNHLVTNILDFTRLPEPRLASIRIDDVIGEALSTAGVTHEEGLRVEVEVPADEFWLADRGLLIQALVNLLRNAAQALDGAGEIRVRADVEAHRLSIRVSDDGPGVPPGDEETIFTPFFSTKERGTGLGLAVARAAILAHDGTLALEPTGAGATFVLTLPAETPPALQRRS